MKSRLLDSCPRRSTMRVLLFMLSLVIPASSSTPGLRAGCQEPKTATPTPNPHHHARGDDVRKEVAPEIKIVESSVPENAELQNLMVNKSQRFSSFTVTTEEGLERILVRQVLLTNRADKVYEIQGVAWPNRPLSDSVWSGDYFIFDRSSSPNAAIHYVFDMKKRALVEARAFRE
jgi:hypothetical protein